MNPISRGLQKYDSFLYQQTFPAAVAILVATIAALIALAWVVISHVV